MTTNALQLQSNSITQVDHYESSTGIQAQTGIYRMANTQLISWRNAGNSADLTWGVNASDQFAFGTTNERFAANIITNHALVTAVATDFVLLYDNSDGLIKRADVTDFLSAASQTPWTSQIDANANSLINLAFVEDNSATPATGGFIRMGLNTAIAWRNAADDNNNSFFFNGVDDLVILFDGANGYEFGAANSNYIGRDIVNVGHFEDNSANPANNGTIRMGNNTVGLAWRNNANSNNCDVFVSVSDEFVFRVNGVNKLVVGSTIIDINNGIFAGWQVLESNTTNPAGAGAIRLGNTELISWRNAGDTADDDIGIAAGVFSVDISGGARFQVNSTGVIMGGHNIGGVGILSFADVNTSLDQVGANIQYDVATTGDIHDFRTANGSAVTIGNLGVDLLGRDLDNVQNIIHDLSTATSALSFANDELQTISITANIVFTGTAYATGKSKSVRIITDGTLRTLGFPTGWVFVGTKPTDQAASKTGILSLTCFGTAEADVVASYAVQT